MNTLCSCSQPAFRLLSFWRNEGTDVIARNRNQRETNHAIHPEQVSHLLWCILVALRTAVENHHITSERGKRRFITEWLSGARRIPTFKGMSSEFMTIRQLLENERNRPIDDVLTALWTNAVSTGNCDLFRFRAVLNSLLGLGWKHCLCPGLSRL